MTQPRRPAILVTPVDWGLGHASRSVPVIRQLVESGAKVYAGASPGPARLIRAAFPDLRQLPMPSYGVRYPTSNMAVNLAMQSPRVAWAVNRERRLTRSYARDHRLDAVISDGRIGCHDPSLRSILVNHQLSMRGYGPVTTSALRAIGRAVAAPFDEIWVPDQSTSRLSGALSSPWPGLPVRHIGPLSSLSRLPREEPEYDILAIVSGPEPQRSEFERIVLAALARTTLRAALVRGVASGGVPSGGVASGGTADAALAESPGRLDIVPFADATKISAFAARSRVILARSGYSTVMDVDRLAMPAILVPTPGQTEQMYLAERLASAGRIMTAPQEAMDLEALFAGALARGATPPAAEGNELRLAVDTLLEHISAGHRGAPSRQPDS